MKPAIHVDVNHCFRWQNDLYVVVRHEEHTVIVQRIATYWPEESNPGNHGWKFVEDKYRREENFNPSCEVNTEFSPERQHA